ncbi:transmembrane protein 231-like [Ischnura elegans]|uniref:transmembrane protein 231-like n=1 Tax=Ischnura elegans TaxID=197161 RepID=UPI001ED891DC|nr:transmembrane protein 231-like [Ischnura elegans]
MAIYQLHSQCVACKYRNSFFSGAFVFVVTCLLLAFIPPLLIIHGYDGFSRQTEFQMVKPNVHFKHEFLLILETNEMELPTVCGTIAFHPLTSTNRHICSVTKVIEEDVDRDGKNDKIDLELEIPLIGNEKVQYVKLFLLFDYKLTQLSDFTMETMGFIEKEGSCAGGSRLDIFGDLRLLLKEPLVPYAEDMRYDYPIFKADNDMIDIPSILRAYSTRNASTHIFPMNALWTIGRGPSDPFILTVSINYTDEQVMFHASIFKQILWVWIQYLALLLPFLYISKMLCSWAFKNGIISAGVVVDPPLIRNLPKKMY